MGLTESDVHILEEALKRYKYSLYGEPHLTLDARGFKYLNQIVDQVDRLLDSLGKTKSNN